MYALILQPKDKLGCHFLICLADLIENYKLRPLSNTTTLLGSSVAATAPAPVPELQGSHVVDFDMF